MSESTHTILRVVHLPLDEKGKPKANACRHLAVIDRRTGRILRFHRMTRRVLEQAEGGQAVLNERAQQGRLRAFLSYLVLGGRLPPL